MTEKTASVYWQVGKALHTHFDRVVNEPLPQRWVELIRYLNEKERAQAEAEAGTGARVTPQH